MNPNSRNQQWSQWSFIVTRPWRPGMPFDALKTNVARFLRKGFGSAARCRIAERNSVADGRLLQRFVIELQVEGANANDPDRRRDIHTSMAHFMRNGLGPDVRVEMRVQLLAGSPEDGRPNAQWVVLPSLSDLVNAT